MNELCSLSVDLFQEWKKCFNRNNTSLGPGLLFFVKNAQFDLEQFFIMMCLFFCSQSFLFTIIFVSGTLLANKLFSLPGWDTIQSDSESFLFQDFRSAHNRKRFQIPNDSIRGCSVRVTEARRSRVRIIQLYLSNKFRLQFLYTSILFFFLFSVCSGEDAGVGYELFMFDLIGYFKHPSNFVIFFLFLFWTANITCWEWMNEMREYETLNQ